MSGLEDSAAAVIASRALHPPKEQVRVLSFTLDFAWREALVAIEVDGPMHHRDGAGDRDARRDRLLRANGWIVFRCSDDREVARAMTAVNHLVKTNDPGLQAKWKKANRSRTARANARPDSWIDGDPGPTTGLARRRSGKPGPTNHKRRRP